MAKPNSLAILIVAGIAVGAVGFFLTAPKPSASSITPRIAAPKKPDLGQGFDEEDLKAKFLPVNLSERNSFKPLIVRRTGGLSGTLASDPSAIPPSFAGGETSWFFTGVVELDGSRMALVENRTSGDGMYVGLGESWKVCRVESITAEELVLISVTGDSITLRLNDGSNNIEGEIDEGNSPATVTGPVEGLTAVPEQGGNQFAPAVQAPVVVQDE